MTIYSKAAADADDDLEFKLKRSIQLVKEQKAMAKRKEPQQPTKLEQHRVAIKAAMPDVEAVVKQYSLSLVNSCVSKLYEKAKLKRKAETLRKQIEEIEEQL